MKSLKGVKGIIYAIISSGTFGLIPLFTIPLIGTMGMDEPNILFYRFLFSSIMMGAICLFRGDSLKITKKHLFSILWLGTLYALTALFLIYSYNYLTSGVATTIHFLYPISVSFIMVVFFKEQKSKALIFAALLSLVGVALMCWSGGGPIRLMGIAFAGLTVITYGVYIVGLNQSKVSKLPAEVLTFYILLAGCAIFFTFAQFTTGISAIPSMTAGIYLLALAFLATVISDLTLILAVKYAGSTVTAILGSMEPLVAVTVGVLVFSEYFNYQSFIGLLLILSSVALVILADQRKKKKARLQEEKEESIPELN